ncbi:MAG: aminopeptidase, partial [Planctomycetota bacterium]
MRHKHTRTGIATLACIAIAATLSTAQVVRRDPAKFDQEDKFRQLEEVLPTPNDYRTASGAPGHAYWQQQADHKIAIALDEDTDVLTGSQTITYTNNSPDTLEYLWVQLDRNRFTPDSDERLTQTTNGIDGMSFRQLSQMLAREQYDGGFKITRVEDTRGNPLEHTIVKTMMRIDLPRPL